MFCFFLVSEEQCLNQIFLDEQFGAMDNPVAKKAEEDKKRYLKTSLYLFFVVHLLFIMGAIINV
jgi:hypothetical protein